MDKFIWISIGAVLGANTRYWLNDWAVKRWGAQFPFGTLIINITGSFLLGLFLSLAAEKFIIDPRMKLLVAVGFLGAYTTFSTYMYDSVNLIFSGQWLTGFHNLFGSMLLGATAAVLGILLGKSI